MTLAEIAEIIAEKTDTPYDLVWGVLDEAVNEIVEKLDKGNKLSIRKLGTFTWVKRPKRFYYLHQNSETVSYLTPEGLKLKFTPSTRLKKRKIDMSNNEGMTKYGVLLDDEKEKTSNEHKNSSCPLCGSDLDTGGACPTHGTKPFEPSGD